MDDKELADRVLAIAGPRLTGDVLNIYLRDHSPESFVRDPRVAMALMERCDFVQIDRVPDEHGADGWMVCAANHMRQQQRGEDDSLPRAIVETCVAALEES